MSRGLAGLFKQAIEAEWLDRIHQAAIAWNMIAKTMERRDTSFLFTYTYPDRSTQTFDHVDAWKNTAALSESAGLTVKAAYAYKKLFKIFNDPYYLSLAANNRLTLVYRTHLKHDYAEARYVVKWALDAWNQTTQHPDDTKAEHIAWLTEQCAMLEVPPPPVAVFTHNPYAGQLFRVAELTAPAPIEPGISDINVLTN